MSKDFQPPVHSVASDKTLPEVTQIESKLPLAKLFSLDKNASIVGRAQRDIRKFYDCLDAADGVKCHYGRQLSAQELVRLDYYWPRPDVERPIGILPREVWNRVVWTLRGDTPALLALCLVSRGLWALCRRRIWMIPRQLDTLERQLKFLFGACLQPHAGRDVWELDIIWYPGDVNGRLILEILKQCEQLSALSIHLRHPDGKVEMQQGPSDLECEVLASMIQLMPYLCVFNFRNDYYMNTKMTTSQYSKFSEACADDIGRIRSLDLLGYGHQSLLDFISTPRERKLERLRMDSELDLGDEGLLSLALDSSGGGYYRRGCFVTHFLGLVTPQIKYSVAALGDFRTHAPHLTVLCIKGVQNYEEIRDDERHGKLGSDTWLASALGHLYSLRVLHIGTEYSVPMAALKKLATGHYYRFESLELLNLEASCDSQPYMEQLDWLVSRLVRRRWRNLRHLSLDRRFPVGTQTLKECAQVPRLCMLLVDLEMGRRTVKLMDDLLDTCPRLKDIPTYALRRSKRREEWLARGCPETGERIFLEEVELY